ncbi:hypothetical protein CVT25_001672 [Psilocybe cyanescens]|uniref:HMG box domain-containing protein n=1 Tax=Psilocybe cyanescens TaxID=93625 RepID=A0A409X596_PSICY|nr:hypothetical protein CVT25_001672 [Psilocybe cyanescens]
MSEEGFKPASNLILPDPTHPIQTDLKKKSHARKQPAGHIPRPKNAFILFRCDFVRQKKIPESVENDHRNISRIIGKIWRQMTDEQKEPWKKLADQEKVKHHINYPNYKFATGPSNRKKTKRGDDVPREVQKDGSPKDEEDIGNLLQRAESCPPGALLVPRAIIENNKPAYGDPLTTRDDLSRRPSRVKLYRSAPYDLDVDGQPVGYFEDLAHQHYFAQTIASGSAIPPADKQEGVDMSNGDSMFRGPRLDAVQYPIPDSTTPPEWETSALPLDLDSLYEADYSRPSNQSADFNRDRFLNSSEAMFTDPFNHVLTSLPHTHPNMSLEDTRSLDSLTSSDLYIPVGGDHGERSDMNLTTHHDFPPLHEGDETLTPNELADDIISQFSRDLQMAAPQEGKDF